MSNSSDIRRLLPKMDKVLSWPEISSLEAEYGYKPLRDAVRSSIELLRNELARDINTDISTERISQIIFQTLASEADPSLIHVINGTGVVIHTNLGRSPLPAAAETAIRNIACCYSNLEYDLETGGRGERYSHVEALICRLTGAEAAIVVNNNASAVMLALSTLAKGREVIVSRGELVEIGGSFRIPEVMEQSGAILAEVGTTNRTHPADYRNAINEQTALLLKVHTSNFAIVGFTSETTVSELSAIGHEKGLPVMMDAGSGCLVDLSRYGIPGEETIQQQMKNGADIVTFSGDKLLGGPQAGLIAGRKDIIGQIRKNPLLRAMRIDKLTLAALEATLRLYRDERQAMKEIPTLVMLTAEIGMLRQKAARFLRLLKKQLPEEVSVTTEDGTSSPGGGSFPLIQLPTRLLAIRIPGYSASGIDEALRSTSPPVLGRVYKDTFFLDVRTVNDNETPLLASALIQVYRKKK